MGRGVFREQQVRGDERERQHEREGRGEQQAPHDIGASIFCHTPSNAVPPVRLLELKCIRRAFTGK
jgi:hypothetical protein